MPTNHSQHETGQPSLKQLISYFASTVPHLPEVKLVKLIYVAQLYHYSDYGELLTRTRFFSFSYGPHAPTIRSALQEQLESNAVYCEKSRTSKDPIFSNPVMIIKSHESKAKELPAPCLSTLKEVVEDWGDKNFEELLDYTTRTIPFVSTAFREQIDLTLTQPFSGLKRSLSLPQRVQIHGFVEAGEALDQDVGHSESSGVSINDVTEIYLALCGDLPDKVPSREHLGFNPQPVIEAFESMGDKDNDGAEKYPTDIDKAAHLTESMLGSMCFRSYSGRVALKTGMLFLRRSGCSFDGDVLEESWPQGTDYESLREWFARVGKHSRTTAEM